MLVQKPGWVDWAAVQHSRVVVPVCDPDWFPQIHFVLEVLFGHGPGSSLVSLSAVLHVRLASVVLTEDPIPLQLAARDVCEIAVCSTSDRSFLVLVLDLVSKAVELAYAPIRHLGSSA